MNKISTLSPGLAREYSAGSTYEAGQYVLYRNAYWKCSVAISVPEEWTPGHWVLDDSPLDHKADLVDGMVPSSQLPAYVDDVLTFDRYEDFPRPGSDGKIYVAKDTNVSYRWSESDYIAIAVADYNSLQNHPSINGVTLTGSKTTKDLHLVERKELIPEWAANTQYSTTSAVVHEGKFYLCKTAHRSGSTWDGTKWEETTLDKVMERYGKLTPIYSDTPTFSEWTFSDVSDGITDIQQPVFYPSTGEPFWNVDFIYDGLPKQAGVFSGDENATNLTLVYRDEGLNLHLTATRTRTDIIGYTLGSQSDNPLAPADPLLFAQYYPEGNVKSAAEFTPGIKYDAPDMTNRTITVKPFCFTDITDGDNRDLAGRVVIPPFVDASGKGYISDDGTRYRVVGVSGTDSVDTGGLLTAIIAPNTVKIIGDNAFYQCQKLTSVSFPAATDIGTDIGSAFFDCNALSVVSLPSAKNIGMCGLGHCDVLTSVSIPAVTNVGEAAFSDCHALTSVDFGDTPRPSVPTLGNGAFSGVSTTCKIIVPDGQYDAWTAETLPDESSNPWYALVTAGYKFLKYSEWEYARKYEVDGKLNKMEAIAWSSLKALRDDGNLVPGQQYRITDYVATTNGDMESRSANHPFDIIVTADDERTLNEHARAMMHETVLDFSLDTRYAVGDFCKHKGTVYRCIRAYQGEWNSAVFLADSPDFYGCDFAAWDVWYCLDNDTSRFAWALAEGATDPRTGTTGRGVVYRLVDEFQNDAPYDFKGLQFKAYGDTDEAYCYTFHCSKNYDRYDLSLTGAVVGNYMGPYFGETGSILAPTHIQKLNRIVVAVSQRTQATVTYNVFEGGCRSITCRGTQEFNRLGRGCYDILFAGHTQYTILGSGCHSSSFRAQTQHNTFGSDCSNNIFGKALRYTTFGSGCSNNTFGDYCNNNTFGAHCVYNTFGNYCVYNTFGDACSYNTFGASASSLKSYMAFITFESGVQYVSLSPTGTTSSSLHYRNVTVFKGIKGTSDAPKVIEDPNVNQSFKTTYQPANSEVISI